MQVIAECPTCIHENEIEVVGMKVEAATCQHCGTELYLFFTDSVWQVVRIVRS